MRTHRTLLTRRVVWFLLFTTAVVTLAASDAAAQANVEGQWRSLPYTTPINPIHVGLMHTGKIAIMAGSENDATQTVYRAAVFDPRTGTITPQTVPWDLFCNGMSFLPDGRLLVVGGTQNYYPFLGIKTTTIFDPATEKFIQVQDMAHGRWYPSNTLLHDGGTMTFSGYTEAGPATNQAVEIYDVPTGWSPEYEAPFLPPLYPWLHLLPNGTVFFSGSTGTSHIFNPTTATWTLGLAQTNYTGDRVYGSSVLLPLTPDDDYAARIMIMGGTLNPATSSVELIDLSVPSPRWRLMPPMSAARTDMNAVILPNGKILAVGGSLQHNVASGASLQADIFDPETETWSPAGTQAFARMYHSVALLLPDATVWSAGSNPSPGTYERRMEIYSPPYLFTTDSRGNVTPATRPTITSAPARVGYNAAFTVPTPDAARIRSVVLIRPGSNTHGFDFDQRMITLDFTPGPGRLTVTSPPHNRIAPPGHYMLFILDDRGVPSVARFVQLMPSPTNQPPQGVITNPSADVTITAGQSVTFAGSGTDEDGSVAAYQWIFPGGSRAASASPTPGAVVFPNPGTYVVSLTVVDNDGENHPSPPSRTITVLPRAGALTASFTSPAEGATVSDTTTIGMSETGGSAPVTFRLSIDGTVVSIQSVNTSTASHLWAAAGAASGIHTLSFTVTDSRGQTATATRSVNVAPTPFTASFTYPAQGALVGGSQTVGMSTTAPWGAAKIFALAVDGTTLVSQSTNGTTFWYQWDTTPLPDGPHTLTLSVTDNAYRTATTTLSVTIANSGPPPPPPALTAAITSPAEGATVSGTTSIAVSESNGALPVTFALSVDGGPPSSQTVSGATASFSWDTTTVVAGAHTLTLTVTDSADRTATVTRRVTVANGQPPPASFTASFSYPGSGAAVGGLQTVGMSTTAPWGQNKTWTLSVGETLIATATNTATTFWIEWDTTGMPDGPHTLTLTVAFGGQTATATRPVTVANGGPPPPTPALTASITSPSEGTTVSGTTGVAMTGSHGTLPMTFALGVDGVTQSTQTVSSTSASFAWDTAAVAAGAHRLTLTVTDAGGRSATAARNVTVSNDQPPPAGFTAAFTYPPQGTVTGGSLTVGVSTTAPWGQTKTWTLAAGSTAILTDTNTFATLWYQWDTTAIPNGPHTLTIQVSSGGQTATATRDVTISN